jgi:hypothetical protein
LTGQITGGAWVKIQPVTPGTNGGYIQINSACPNGTTNNACANEGSDAFQVTGGAVVTAPQLFVRGNCAVNGAGSSFTGTVT